MSADIMHGADIMVPRPVSAAPVETIGATRPRVIADEAAQSVRGAVAPAHSDMKNASDLKQDQADLAQKIDQSVEQLNAVMESFGKSIRFRTFEDTDQMYIEIFNASSDEVVRTIPSESMLRLMTRFNDFLGMIIDTEV